MTAENIELVSNVDALNPYRVRGLSGVAGAGLSIIQSIGIYLTVFLMKSEKINLYYLFSVTLIFLSILLTLKAENYSFFIYKISSSSFFLFFAFFFLFTYLFFFFYYIFFFFFNADGVFAVCFEFYSLRGSSVPVFGFADFSPSGSAVGFLFYLVHL